MRNKLVLDFETYYDSKTYTLRKQSMLEYVRDSRFKVHGFGYVWVTDEGWAEPEWVSAARAESWLRSKLWEHIDVIMHNAKFDGLILTQHYGVHPAGFIDTKGMSRAVLGKTVPSHALSQLAKHFGLEDKGVMKTDGLRDLSPQEESELAEYCLHDVDLTAEIYWRLAKQFPANQYQMLDWTVRTFVEPRLKLDVALLEQTAAQEAGRKATIFSDLGLDKAIFSSNVKFPKLLESEGFEVPKKVSPRTGKEIPAIALGDTEFLDMVESENERLRILCEARVAAKSTLLETRSGKLAKIGATGKWSFDVEFSGANQTHRFSGGKGAGGNPQNFTRGSSLRKAVQAPAGYQLIVGDFSNIELRMVAYLSKDPGLIEAIENNVDLYCDFASVFFERKVTKEDEAERRFGKCAILGLGYGMGAAKFKKTVRLQTGQTITDVEAARAVDLYRARYVRVPQLWYMLNSQIGLMAKEGEHIAIGTPIRFQKEAILLPSGLKMRYPNLRQRDGDMGPEWVYDVYAKEKTPRLVKLYGGKVLENVSQGLAGELCKEVAQQFGDNVTGLVHDEIHLLVRTPLVSFFKKRLEHAMTQPPAWMPSLRLKAEVGVGPNWLQAK